MLSQLLPFNNGKGSMVGNGSASGQLVAGDKNHTGLCALGFVLIHDDPILSIIELKHSDCSDSRTMYKMQ